VVPRPRSPLAAQATSRHFDGQLPGEQVIWFKRRSLLSLLTTAWPLFVGIFLLGLLGLFAGASPVVPLLQLVGLVLLAGYAIWWLATACWNWYFAYYVLTDRRVVKTSGYPNQRREEIGLKSIAQVRVEIHNPIAVVLGVGDVEVRPVGTPILLASVRYPRDVADSILDMAEAHEKSKDDAPPQVAHPRLQAALDELAQPKPLPKAASLLRPPLGSFLHRTIPLRLIDGEEVLDVVYRHWFILLRNELPAIGLLVAGIAARNALGVTGLGGPLPLLALVGGVLGGLVVGVLTYLNWADDVFILTTQRIVDVDRLFFILAEYSSDAPYARVQNVQVAKTLLGQVLGFGSIVVETSGRKHPVRMMDIPHAFRIMDHIFEQIHLIRERESVAAINKQKQENHRWMARVLNELVVTVPDVRGRSLLDAMAAVQQAGLRLVVETERPVLRVPAGQVLEQLPLAGSVALAGSEVRVSVSGSGVPVRPY
jgi:membrane protein YdbS with pleckstrin-like domain